MSGMLQMGLNKIDYKFTVPNTVTVEGQTYKDAVDHGNEHWTLAGILEQSSNVGMVIAGDKMTNEQRYNFISKFGIGQATGLNLPGESEGVLRHRGACRRAAVQGRGDTRHRRIRGEPDAQRHGIVR